jgi:peptidyl-dipeptidase Dcp
LKHLQTLITAGGLALVTGGLAFNARAAAEFGPANPFYAPSRLPFQAPPFDKLKDTDYQPAIEAGMVEEIREMDAIAQNPAAPTFDNTIIEMEKTGQLLKRALDAFHAVSEANTNPTLQAVKTELAPKLAAHDDAIRLNEKLFRRVEAVFQKRDSLHLDPESLRLVEVVYDRFIHAGANLTETNKARLKQLNEEASSLSDAFTTKLLDATKDAGYQTADQSALSGLSESQIAAAAQAAHDRGVTGYVIALQNTTQQPALGSLTERATRTAIFQSSWMRAERGNVNDTRDTLARLAQLRAQRAALLGFPSHAAWKLEDQMAKTPEAALQFMEALVPLATAKAKAEAGDIQAVINAQNGGFPLQAWDWDFYAEQVRKAKYDLRQAEVKPYFELNSVLENGVFYAAHLLYGISFKERRDIPVYQPDVRVFEVIDANGKALALFYCDYFKRDNKNGGAWMSEFVGQSGLMKTRPVVYNVANLPKPAPGQPALISFSDVITMFHEFGHALHGMFSNVKYPTLAGTSTARDFVEFPSQFNEHWATYPSVFANYAKHHATGQPMPPELADKIMRARNFNEGYMLTELLAAAELDMQWHALPADAPLQDPDTFEQQALAKMHVDIAAVPPRYRSSYFSHIWGSGYSAGYYAYLWTQMLADDGYAWFDDHGGLTRANGDRFRHMVLSRGNSQELGKMYKDWRGAAPTVDAMMKYRGLRPE